MQCGHTIYITWKDSLSFVLEITGSYIHWKNDILIDNLAKANVQDHEINY